MDMFDEAQAMVGTLELCKITQGELAERMGVSQSYIANKLRLLSLSEKERVLIREHNLSERHARALLRLSDEEDRLTALSKVIEMKLNVRECEAIVEMLHDSAAPKRLYDTPPSERIDKFVETLRQSLSTLRSLGIDAREYTDYLENRMYITVCINGI